MENIMGIILAMVGLVVMVGYLFILSASIKKAIGEIDSRDSIEQGQEERR